MQELTYATHYQCSPGCFFLSSKQELHFIATIQATEQMHIYEMLAWTESPYHGCLEQQDCISTDLSVKNILIFLQIYFKALISRRDQHTFDPCRALPVGGTLDSGLPKDGISVEFPGKILLRVLVSQKWHLNKCRHSQNLAE